jgi:transcriptional regulator with XRE-family HTH domain
MDEFDNLIPDKPDKDVPFDIWLKSQFESWVAEQLGKGRGVKKRKDFAEYLGVTENNLSQWVLKKRLPTGDNVDQLALRLGSEVYDRLNIPRRVPKSKTTYFVMDNLHFLENNELKELIETLKNRRETRAGRRRRANTQDPELA